MTLNIKSGLRNSQVNRKVNMKINVLNKDFGFLTEEAITVQRYDFEGNLVFCNHAGAIEETASVDIPRIEQQDISFMVTTLVCDKCEAYQRQGEDQWEDAPLEGKHYE